MHPENQEPIRVVCFGVAPESMHSFTVSDKYTLAYQGPGSCLSALRQNGEPATESEARFLADGIGYDHLRPVVLRPPSPRRPDLEEGVKEGVKIMKDANSDFDIDPYVDAVTGSQGFMDDIFVGDPVLLRYTHDRSLTNFAERFEGAEERLRLYGDAESIGRFDHSLECERYCQILDWAGSGDGEAYAGSNLKRIKDWDFGKLTFQTDEGHDPFDGQREEAVKRLNSLCLDDTGVARHLYEIRARAARGGVDFGDREASPEALFHEGRDLSILRLLARIAIDSH